jgi:hypothetical protein
LRQAATGHHLEVTLLSLFRILGVRRTLLGWLALAVIRRLLKQREQQRRTRYAA